MTAKRFSRRFSVDRFGRYRPFIPQLALFVIIAVVELLLSRLGSAPISRAEGWLIPAIPLIAYAFIMETGSVFLDPSQITWIRFPLRFRRIALTDVTRAFFTPDLGSIVLRVNVGGRSQRRFRLFLWSDPDAALIDWVGSLPCNAIAMTTADSPASPSHVDGTTTGEPR